MAVSFLHMSGKMETHLNKMDFSSGSFLGHLVDLLCDIPVNCYSNSADVMWGSVLCIPK